MIVVREVSELRSGDCVLVDVNQTDLVRAVDPPKDSYTCLVWFVGTTDVVELHETDQVLVRL